MRIPLPRTQESNSERAREEPLQVDTSFNVKVKITISWELLHLPCSQVPFSTHPFQVADCS